MKKRENRVVVLRNLGFMKHFQLAVCTVIITIILILHTGEALPEMRIVAPSIIMRGIETVFSVEIIDNNTIDSNWYGTLHFQMDIDTKISINPIDIVKGRNLEPVTIKNISSGYINMTVIDNSGRLTDNNFSFLVKDPEKEGAGLLFSELMYNTDNDRRKEWIEIYNNTALEINLEGLDIVVSDAETTSRSYCCLMNDATVTWFEGQKIVPAHGYLLIVRDLSVFTFLYPDVIDGILVGISGYDKTILVEAKNKADSFNMPNTSGTVYIREGTTLGNQLHSLVCYESTWGGGKNISLERRSPVFPSSSKMNWTSSIVSGGTPGKANSVSVPEKSQKSFGISLYSDTISKKSDRLTVRVDSDQDAFSVNVKLCGMNGNEVAVLDENKVLEKGTSLLCEYDFALGNNKTIPIGLYFIRVDGKKENGEIVKALRRIVIVE